MRWIPDNLSIYLEGESFFDTILIPCSNIQFGEDKEDEIKRIEESIQKAFALDERLTGRILLMPPMNVYGMVDDLDMELERIFRTFASFSYVLFLPSNQSLEEKIEDYIQNRQLEQKGMVISNGLTVDEAFQKLLKKWQSTL